MAKSKSSARNRSVHSKTKGPVTSGLKGIIRIIIIFLVSVLLLVGIVGAIIKYYRIATNH